MSIVLELCLTLFVQNNFKRAETFEKICAKNKLVKIDQLLVWLKKATTIKTALGHSLIHLIHSLRNASVSQASISKNGSIEHGHGLSYKIVRTQTMARKLESETDKLWGAGTITRKAQT